MADIRWFAPNRFCTLPVSRLQAAGLSIDLAGSDPARLVVAADGVPAREAWRFASRHRIPLVAYIWDLPPWQVGRGRPNPVIDIGGSLLKVPVPWGRYPERSGYYSRLRYVARHAAAVWTPSTMSQAAVAARFGVAAELMPFCYDSDRFHGGPVHQRTGEPTVLCVSRLVPYKNHAAVIRACALQSTVPRVHIVGIGSEATALRGLAVQLGVTLQLDETRQSDERMVDIYRGADVVVSMSRFEGMGLTPLEGVAMGIPTIASDIPPHRELGDGRATLVPLDDDAALAQAIHVALHAGRVVDAAPIAAVTMAACATRMLPRLAELLRTTR